MLKLFKKEHQTKHPIQIPYHIKVSLQEYYNKFDTWQTPDFSDKEAKKSQENSIFIGGKPFMNYVTGVVIQFNNGANEVKVKARGKFISKGVDVAEVARRKFLTERNVSTKNVSIGSEEFENKEGKLVNVSIIEITLEKE